MMTKNIDNIAPVGAHDFKYVYLVKSYTGRYNSGVMLIKKHSKVRRWLDIIVTARHKPILAVNNVGWGEWTYH